MTTVGLHPHHQGRILIEFTLYPPRGLSSEPSMAVGALGRPPGAPPGPPGVAPDGSPGPPKCDVCFLGYPYSQGWSYRNRVSESPALNF